MWSKYKPRFENCSMPGNSTITRRKTRQIDINSIYRSTTLIVLYPSPLYRYNPNRPKNWHYITVITLTPEHKHDMWLDITIKTKAGSNEIQSDQPIYITLQVSLIGNWKPMYFSPPIWPSDYNHKANLDQIVQSIKNT